MTGFLSRGKIPFINLLINKVPKRIGTAGLLTTWKTTLALDSFLLTCNVFAPKLPMFWCVSFFNDGRLFAYICFSPPTSRKSARMRFCLVPVKRTLFTGCMLLAMSPT